MGEPQINQIHGNVLKKREREKSMERPHLPKVAY